MNAWLDSSRDRIALLTALLAPIAVTAALVPFRTSFQNTDAALLLVVVMVAVSAWGNRLAGLVAAVSAAVWFDFFLTRPYDRFSITRRGDIETTVLLLVIGAVVTELAVRGRQHLAAANRRAGYLSGLHAAARAVSTGSSTTQLRSQVTDQLVRVLDLQTCRYQTGVAGLGDPPRLQQDGLVTAGSAATGPGCDTLPGGKETELLVEGHGLLQGRFLMTPGPGAHPDLERRLVAVALADQLGAALSGVEA
jgi:K+-sensing histidine kinase KdpD